MVELEALKFASAKINERESLIMLVVISEIKKQKPCKMLILDHGSTSPRSSYQPRHELELRKRCSVVVRAIIKQTFCHELQRCHFIGEGKIQASSDHIDNDGFFNDPQTTEFDNVHNREQRKCLPLPDIIILGPQANFFSRKRLKSYSQGHMGHLMGLLPVTIFERELEDPEQIST